MKSQKNKLICNNFISFICSYYARLTNGLNERKVHLQSLLHDEKYSRVVKHAGRYAGRRPSWHIETSLLTKVRAAGFGKYVKQFPRAESKEFDDSLSKAEKLMTTTVSFSGNKKRLMAATQRAYAFCKFPEHKFVPTTPRYAAENQLNRSSSSGYPDFKRKGHVLDKLVLQAERLFLGLDQFVWDWPMTRGFRMQVRESLGELNRKIRIMYPCPGAVILLEDCFIIPFVDHFINTDTFYVIGKNGKQIGSLLKERFKGKGKLHATDISAYDQNMLNEVILCAFGILRAQLQLTFLQAKAFDKMVLYFCTSTMVSKTADRKTYAFIKDHGVPSGSGFTNMIDTLCQAIVIEYIEPGLLESCLLCGDDNLFVLGAVSYNSYCEIFQKVFNLPIDPIKSTTFNDWSNCYFLGFKWLNGIRYISPLLAINQCLWHTDFITDLDPYEREVARSASVLLNGVNGAYYFEKIFPELVHSARLGIDIRFMYLYGTAPPSTFAGVTGKFSASQLKATPRVSESLLTHLDNGWAIR